MGKVSSLAAGNWTDGQDPTETFAHGKWQVHKAACTVTSVATWSWYVSQARHRMHEADGNQDMPKPLHIHAQ